jgi:hypothetical protein
MGGFPGSRLAALARAQLAMALTAVDGMRRYGELTATYGEELLRTAAAISCDVAKPEGGGWDRAAAHALAGYRDYVRELAALPGIANMHYYDVLGRLRATPAATSPPAPEPTPGLRRSQQSPSADHSATPK